MRTQRRTECPGRETLSPQMFGHLNLKWENHLHHHTVPVKGGGVNSPFKFKDYSASLAKIIEVQRAALAG